MDVGAGYLERKASGFIYYTYKWEYKQTITQDIVDDYIDKCTCKDVCKGEKYRPDREYWLGVTIN